MIVEVVFKDTDLSVGDSDFPGGILETYYLKDPDKKKLAVLKELVEKRYDRLEAEGATGKEIEEAEDFIDNIWDRVRDFIEKNFETVETEEYVIKY